MFGVGCTAFLRSQTSRGRNGFIGRWITLSTKQLSRRVNRSLTPPVRRSNAVGGGSKDPPPASSPYTVTPPIRQWTGSGAASRPGRAGRTDACGAGGGLLGSARGDGVRATHRPPRTATGRRRLSSPGPEPRRGQAGACYHKPALARGAELVATWRTVSRPGPLRRPRRSSSTCDLSGSCLADGVRAAACPAGLATSKRRIPQNGRSGVCGAAGGGGGI